MIESIQKVLLRLQARGSFAVHRSLPADALVLGIHGLGPIAFPIAADTARSLVGEAVRSPFGWRDQTITDLGVRDGWQIAKSRIKVDGRLWNPVLRAALEQLREQLGLSDSGRLTARLDKLTIYGPGQFFKPHQDTEKSESMIGTLVVVLPSRYTGGTARIDRHGQQVEVRRSTHKAPTLDLLAFYSDCHHEIRPIKTGYRIALVYQLDFEAGPAPLSASLPDPALTARTEPLIRAIADYFATPQTVPYSRNPARRHPEKLVYLLDHEYTQRNLDWSRLKQADGLRSLALREAAKVLDLEIFLCLADVHESWQCEPVIDSYWDRGRGRPRRSAGDAADGEHELVELVDSEVDLRHWQDGSGQPTKFDGLSVTNAEICFTTASNDLEPFESNYEGYMGNYGDTLDRWYHRAAVVLWPRSHDFRMLVKTDPASAMQKVLDMIGRTGAAKQTAQEKLGILLELLPDHAHGLQEKALSLVALRLALALDDAALAAELLAPLAPRAVTMAAIDPWCALVDRYGVAWCQDLLSVWHAPPSRLHLAPPWATYSPEWLAGLAGHPAKAGRALARFIVERQWEQLSERLGATTPARSRSPFGDVRRVELAAGVRAMLQACTVVNAKGPYRAAVKHLTGEDSALSPAELATVASDLAERLDDETRASWDFGVLLEHCLQRLESTIAGLRRDDGDVSIAVPRNCSCGDCDELHRFLGSSKVTLHWPMAKDRRQHIHHMIDRMRLPVTHVTRREGSPYTLVLTKTKDLTRIEAGLRREHEQHLETIERHLGGDRAPGGKTTRRKRARHD